VSAEANKAVVRRFLDEVISGGNPSMLGEVMAADVAWHGGSIGEAGNLEELGRIVGPFLAAFPDMRVTVEDLLADGDKVVARHTWEATHSGDFAGVPATGTRVRVTGTNIYRIAGGKIAEEWWQEDLLSLLHQIGAVPKPG
jgi:steroid delta-isomerase-like uncharacterized protein